MYIYILILLSIFEIYLYNIYIVIRQNAKIIIRKHKHLKVEVEYVCIVYIIDRQLFRENDPKGTSYAILQQIYVIIL